MSFWEDASPVVKIALVVGILGIVIIGGLWASGVLTGGSCSHTAEGVEVDGCPDGSQCIDGECVVSQRGFSAP